VLPEKKEKAETAQITGIQYTNKVVYSLLISEYFNHPNGNPIPSKQLLFIPPFL
jgi:hypothetical protein